MINSIRLQNFRSYTDESFEFEPEVNIIVGPNGSGKTNLLEAILAVATGSSYRVDDEELIQFDKPWARLDADAFGSNRSIKIIKENSRVKKSYVFDDKEYKLLNRQHILPVVLFEPDHLQLLHGQPEQRRIYLDNLLEQVIPGFITTRRHYRRVLSQRNALLKSARAPSKEQLFVWNLRLSELGGVIARHRVNLIQEISKELPKLYRSISGGSSVKVTIQYLSRLPTETYETTMLKALEEHYALDIARGFTTFGPHRDDFVVLFNNRQASEVASRGESRTALLALKVYELQLLEKQRAMKPVMLLDDVFSELDGKRRHALAGFLKTHQTFITTTDADIAIDLTSSKQSTIALA
jgi:DNA replication and repair protein RecF